MFNLIIDQYAKQPLHKRVLWNTLTGLGWACWIYLWLPLLSAIAVLSGIHPGQANSAAAHSIRELLTTLQTQATTIMIMITVFVVWALLQWLGRRYAFIKRQSLNPCRVAESIINPDNELKLWRGAQRLVISHYENTGRIRNAIILAGSVSNSDSGHSLPSRKSTGSLILVGRRTMHRVSCGRYFDENKILAEKRIQNIRACDSV